MDRRRFLLAGLAAGLSTPALAQNRLFNFGPSTSRSVNYRGREIVAFESREAPGTLIVRADQRRLYRVLEDGQAVQYGVGVGREGFEWSGIARVGRKAIWPEWRPPKEMIERERAQNGRELPEVMPGGPKNPLGARALYLYQGNRDTLYRIHGTNDPSSIGRALSSGCIRLLNEEIIELYETTPVGTKVIVL